MIELFKILKKAGGGGTPEFLSDHPLTDHRIKAAQDTIQKMGFEPEQ
jgi:predicted Zn-dependent protease